jgi:bifunctional non-homologous end joining protein LigD
VDTTVQVGERTLRLTNLEKVLYPETGTTKAEVIEYYARVAPTLLPHIADRAMTLKRFPDGVETKGFFEKRCPSHRPDWMPTAIGPGDREGEVRYCVLDEPAALVWAANMAALELHAPMALAEDLDAPRAVVFDFDPGAPATIRECCQIALLVQDVLRGVGLRAWAKTSGSKGLQVYVPVNAPLEHEHASSFALAVGQLLEKEHRARVTTTMAKVVRPGKVFIDWSQNNRHKTTIAVYSLRARPQPTVSTPVMWDEVEASAEGDTDLRFEWSDVLDRIEHHGDLFAEVLTEVQQLPG